MVSDRHGADKCLVERKPDKSPKLLADLPESAITAIIDTREKLPLNLSPLQMVRGTLTTGDYSAKGLEDVIAIERKSLADLVQCVGRERERFEKEVQRLLAYPVRALVVEADWAEVELRQWAAISQIEPKHVKGSLLGWQASGLPVVMAGNSRRAGELVSRMIYIAARRRLSEVRGFVNSILELQQGSN